MNNEQKAQLLPSASLVQNGLLSAVEGNRLIAKFMKVNVADFTWNEHLGLVYCDEHGDFQIDEDLQYYSPNSSWNDLMPVVEKIENLIEKEFDFITVKIERNYSNISVANIGEHLYGLDKHITGKSKIESVYRSVVEFIKWYNNNAVSVGSR